MLGEWASHADLHGKNAVGLMVRRERVQLLETIERSRQIYVPIGARYNDQDKMWRWPNGARLRFAYLERDADADAYQGHSYTRVYVEELGTFPSASPVLRLMATLRSGEGVPCGFRATGNPGGPGHQWVKARYIGPNGRGRGDRRARTQRSRSPLWGARSRALQGGRRPLHRSAALVRSWTLMPAALFKTRSPYRRCSKTADFDDVREGGSRQGCSRFRQSPRGTLCPASRGGRRSPDYLGGPGSGLGTKDGRGWGEAVTSPSQLWRKRARSQPVRPPALRRP